MPMIMDERVEAAARRMCEVDKLAPDPDAPIIWNGKPAKAWEARVPIVLAVAEVLWPELHGDQPKGWIAPWELPYEAELATVTAYALWTQTEIGEIAKAVEHIETTDELKWQDRGWRQGFGTTSGEQIRVVWRAARDAYLGKGDGG